MQLHGRLQLIVQRYISSDPHVGIIDRLIGHHLDSSGFLANISCKGKHLFSGGEANASLKPLQCRLQVNVSSSLVRPVSVGIHSLAMGSQRKKARAYGPPGIPGPPGLQTAAVVTAVEPPKESKFTDVKFQSLPLLPETLRSGSPKLSLQNLNLNDSPSNIWVDHVDRTEIPWSGS